MRQPPTNLNITHTSVHGLISVGFVGGKFSDSNFNSHLHPLSTHPHIHRWKYSGGILDDTFALAVIHFFQFLSCGLQLCDSDAFELALLGANACVEAEGVRSEGEFPRASPLWSTVVRSGIRGAPPAQPRRNPQISNLAQFMRRQYCNLSRHLLPSQGNHNLRINFERIYYDLI